MNIFVFFPLLTSIYIYISNKCDRVNEEFDKWTINEKNNILKVKIRFFL